MKRQIFYKSKTKENLLTDLELEQLMDACRGFIDIFLVSMLFNTGMRVSELVHLKRDWVDWDLGLIHVPKEQVCACVFCQRELKNVKEVVTKPSGVWRPKTPEAVRPIPIVSEIRGLLKEFFTRHNEVIEIIPSRGAAYTRLKRITQRTNIEHNVFPHAARGTFATLLARKGFTGFELIRIMGWKSIKTAEDYIKLSGAAVKQAFKEKW